MMSDREFRRLLAKALIYPMFILTAALLIGVLFDPVPEDVNRGQEVRLDTLPKATWFDLHCVPATKARPSSCPY